MCLYANIAENITALLVGMHQNLRRVYQNPNQRNLPAYRNTLWAEFYEVNIKKEIYEVEYQDICLDKTVYDNSKMVETERVTIYTHIKIYVKKQNRMIYQEMIYASPNEAEINNHTFYLEAKHKFDMSLLSKIYIVSSMTSISSNL